MGTVPPKTASHQPCRDCRELHLPLLKYLHSLAFTLRETISKLIIWIFFPLLFYFQSCFASISTLSTFMCSSSLLPRFSRHGLQKYGISEKLANQSERLISNNCTQWKLFIRLHTVNFRIELHMEIYLQWFFPELIIGIQYFEVRFPVFSE